MSIHPTLYSSRSEEWPTPQDFYDELDAEFHFTLDPCATEEKWEGRAPFRKRTPSVRRREAISAFSLAHCYISSADPPLGAPMDEDEKTTLKMPDEWHEKLRGQLRWNFQKGMSESGKPKRPVPTEHEVVPLRRR
jgi:hypothetical protein